MVLCEVKKPLEVLQTFKIYLNTNVRNHGGILSKSILP